MPRELQEPCDIAPEDAASDAGLRAHLAIAVCGPRKSDLVRPILAALVLVHDARGAIREAHAAPLHDLAEMLGESIQHHLRVEDSTSRQSQKSAERHLGASLLEPMLQSGAPLLMFRLDTVAGRLIDISPSLETLLGYSREEAIATPDFLRVIQFDAANLDAFDPSSAQASRGPGTPCRDVGLRHRDGHTVTFRGAIRPVSSEEGAFVGVEGVFVDVSAEGWLRQRLGQADKLSTLGLLAAGVAHEINNPAAFIMLGLGVLERTLKGRDVRMEGTAASTVADLLQELRESIQRIASIADDLRSFTKQSSTEPNKLVLVDVNRSLESALNLTRGRIVDRAQLEVRLSDVPLVQMAEGRLGQIAVNLLVQAAQSIPRSGSKQRTRDHVIAVASRSDDQTVDIEMSTTGSTIPAAKLPHIWDALAPGNWPDAGNTLNLSSCRESVEQAGGTLRVESPIFAGGPEREPYGTRFVLSMPAVGAQIKPSEVAATVMPAARSSRARLLIVEDEAPLGRALSDHLGRVHEVTLASSADDALRLLAEGRHYDVVMCDLRMPGMSGEAFYAHIAESDPELARGLIFMTGVGFGEDVERFLATCGRPLLEKPFTADQALQAIAEVSARRGR
ncbi:uncharacterized protein CMC5_037870 [Chondromyces crocatus]|uniref:histidine kinase n=1 Tax=Chondromyces crocatus TaxID=52 RepID=A0A0K1EGD5_CHOCO|nr:uncharacterized protein CMC5_037870 [Chondromyces crocatus]